MGLRRYKEGIEHIDTNIIIRLITEDDAKQVKKAKKLIAQKQKTYVFEDAAMMEVVFVLSGPIYRYSRQETADSIKTLMLIPNIYFNKGLIEDALNLYVDHPKLSFVDCYLAAVTNISDEQPLWTLDHKLAAQCPIAREL